MLTALSGFATALAALFLVRQTDWPLHLKSLTVIFFVIAAMAAVDGFYFRTFLNASTGLAPRPLRPLDAGRVLRKLVGFWLTIAILVALYALLPEYTGDYYAPAWAAAKALAPVLFIVAPFYVGYVDRRQLSPEDSYADIGAFVIDRRMPDMARLAQHARGWAVKGFFFPLMFVILTNDIGDFCRASFAFADFQAFYEWAYNSAFLIDVLFAAIGYLATLRLTDTHIRSAEPTMFGWVICLVCYQPFWSVVEGSYFHYEADGIYWGTLFHGSPVIYALWGSAILACMAVYAFSTVAFGLRFSNLTHRGIITSGPYRWVKHPAYIGKNMAFWLISVPFLSTDLGSAVRQSILLLGVNAIYVARAITEERHLSKDPAYVAYAAWIREHGLVARLKRLVAAAPTNGALPVSHGDA